MAFKFRIGFKNVKKYKKLAKDHTFEEIIKIIESDYKNLDNNEKRIIKIKIKDMINEIEKLSLIGMLITLATGFINNLFNDYKFIGALILLSIYIMIAFSIIHYTNYYRICKIYLEVIESIQESDKK